MFILYYAHVTCVLGKFSFQTYRTVLGAVLSIFPFLTGTVVRLIAVV